MKSLKNDLFENDEVKNLSACVGGVVYATCNDNCADEAGSKSASGVLDDIYDSNDDCPVADLGGSGGILSSNLS